MSELRRDPVIGRWNIIDTDEPMGPQSYAPERRESVGKHRCPFCPGNESLTPPEITAVRPEGSAPNSSGWQIRVVPNKFPALRVEGDLARRGMGLFDLCNGIGAHEVIMETPDHQKQMADLSVEELARVIQMFAARSLDLRGDRRLKYTMLFKNYGLSAGATLEHAHSQLIALPIIPKRVSEELKGAEKYFEFRERCVYCDILQQERQDEVRIIGEGRSFMAFCPFVSSFPFETWIVPTEHHSDFAQIDAQDAGDLARILKDTLTRLRTVLSDPSYNFVIHTAPVESKPRDSYHWYVELIPKLTKVAGFEWGTGFYINPTPPELAALHLRSASQPV